MNQRMTRDIVVRLSDGTYHLTEPFELVDQGDLRDSGTHGHVIRYEAAPGAHPILSGGTRIQGWTVFDRARSIYRAVVPKTMKTRQLYVKGVRALRARGRVDPPNYRRSPDPIGIPGFFISEDAPDVPHSNWKNQSHLELVSRNEFMSFRCPVESTERTTQHWMVASTGVHFNPPANWPFASADGAQHRVGDFNGDGRSDLLLTWPKATTPRRDAIAFSVGSGFAAPVRLDLPKRADPGTYLVGDFDGNGTSDLLVAYRDDRSAWHNDVFLSRDSGFEAQPRGGDWLPDEGRGCVYRVGDFDGDGRSDLLLASRPDASGRWRFDVALSDGASFRFPSKRTWLASVAPNSTWHIGNFDGDPKGRSDLLLAYTDAQGRHNDVVLSNGTQFDEASRSDWLPHVDLDATYHVGNFDGDAEGRSDLLLSYLDASGAQHHRAAISDGHAFRLGDEIEALFPETGGLETYVGNFDGDSPKHDDLLASGLQTFVRMQPTCWAPTQPSRLERVSWLENALELLDAPREWYLDEETPCPDAGSRCLYYMPGSGEDMASDPVVAATLETLVRGHGDPSTGRWLHDVQFRGITFAFGTWLEPSSPQGYVEIQAGWHGASPRVWTRTPGNLTFTQVRALAFRDNVFTHLGAVGLNLDTASQDNVVEGNIFTDISSTAIQLGDVDDFANPLSRTNSGNTIANNYVSRVAVEYESAVGIWTGYVRNTTIRNNEIGDLPYTGISLGWGWGTTSYAASNQVKANFIHDTMTVLHDGGAIYTLSAQPWSTLSRNYILNSGHIGIYHDDGSRYFTDTNNVVSHAAYWFTISVTSRSHRLADNWADYDNYQCRALGPPPGSARQCSPNGNRVENNHFVESGAWPRAAQAIIDAAGLEGKFRRLREGLCGDATCTQDETASSCPSDCR